MLLRASPWHCAQALPLRPAGSLHSFSPRATHSMPGLPKSSACSARTSAPANSRPDWRGWGRCGSAACAPAKLQSRRAADRRPTRSLIPQSSSLSLQLWSDDRNGGALGAALAAVVHPRELDRAARLGDRAELERGIRRDARAHPGAKDFDAVVARDKVVDDVLGYRPAALVVAKAGLHRVLDRDPDHDYLAALSLLRHLHSRYHPRLISHAPLVTNYRSLPLRSIQARRFGHLHFRRAVPDRAVRHPGERGDVLRAGEPDAGNDLRASRARAQ